MNKFDLESDEHSILISRMLRIARERMIYSRLKKMHQLDSPPRDRSSRRAYNISLSRLLTRGARNYMLNIRDFQLLDSQHVYIVRLGAPESASSSLRRVLYIRGG